MEKKSELLAIPLIFVFSLAPILKLDHPLVRWGESEIYLLGIARISTTFFGVRFRQGDIFRVVPGKVSAESHPSCIGKWFFGGTEASDSASDRKRFTLEMRRFVLARACRQEEAAWNMKF